MKSADFDSLNKRPAVQRKLIGYVAQQKMNAEAGGKKINDELRKSCQGGHWVCLLAPDVIQEFVA